MTVTRARQISPLKKTFNLNYYELLHMITAFIHARYEISGAIHKYYSCKIMLNYLIEKHEILLTTA